MFLFYGSILNILSESGFLKQFDCRLGRAIVSHLLMKIDLGLGEEVM